MRAQAESAGGRLLKVDPGNTTQNCSLCGECVRKSLSDRMHECPYCGLVLDRDLNASKNVLKIGRGPPEFKPAEERTTTPQVVVQVYRARWVS